MARAMLEQLRIGVLYRRSSVLQQFEPTCVDVEIFSPQLRIPRKGHRWDTNQIFNGVRRGPGGERL
eukprot:12890209-Prorocentrum_lima.AAC.1